MAAPRRKNPFFDDLFPDFNRIDELFEQLFKDMSGPEFQRKLSREPLVYGVNVRVGPGGKAHVEPFGNVNVQEGKISDEREPLVDVIEEKEHVRVIVELPGVTKEAVKLENNDSILTIQAHSQEQKFKKRIKLPAEVLDEGTKATLKNGILEVVLKKRKPSKPKASEIKVQ